MLTLCLVHAIARLVVQCRTTRSSSGSIRRAGAAESLSLSGQLQRGIAELSNRAHDRLHELPSDGKLTVRGVDGGEASSVPLSGVYHLLVGKQTDVFDTEIGQTAIDEHSFSLATKAGHTLDLEASSNEERDDWLLALKDDLESVAGKLCCDCRAVAG